MTLAAAIGYAIGIIIFAIFFRRRRKQMTEKFIEEAHSKISKSNKGNQE